MIDPLRRTALRAWGRHTELMLSDALYPVLMQAVAELLITRRVNLTRFAAAIATALMAYFRPPWDEPDDPYAVHY
jgi:hypothetical protein